MGERVEPRELMARILPLIEARHDEAWLVGGWVRDRLLGRETRDIDLVVPSGAVATARELADVLRAPFVLLDMERDTARVLVGPPSAVIYLDLAGLRAPGIEVDLLARDFTVNAMAVPLACWDDPEAAVIDPTGGRRDLELRLLRAVSADSFRDDPLRMLRAVRLPAALDFSLESGTAAWAQRDAGLLATVSRERVRDEFVQTLDLPGAAESLRRLDELFLLEQVVPELAGLRAVAPSGDGQGSALEHSIQTVAVIEALRRWLAGGALGDGWAYDALATALAPYRAELAAHLAETLPGGRTAGVVLALAALLHDVGKGGGQREGEAPGGKLLGHDVVGASLAAMVMRRLCFSGAETGRVRLSVRNHMRPGEMVQGLDGAPSRRAIYRFYRDAQPSGVETVLLSLADHVATRGPALDPAHWQRHLAVSVALLEAYFRERARMVEPPPVVDGHELMSALDLSPGPEVGGLLDNIREAQAAGEVRTRNEALDLARELLAKGGPL